MITDVLATGGSLELVHERNISSRHPATRHQQLLGEHRSRTIQPHLDGCLGCVSDISSTSADTVAVYQVALNSDVGDNKGYNSSEAWPAAKMDAIRTTGFGLSRGVSITEAFLVQLDRWHAARRYAIRPPPPAIPHLVWDTAARQRYHCGRA